MCEVIELAQSGLHALKRRGAKRKFLIPHICIKENATPYNTLRTFFTKKNKKNAPFLSDESVTNTCNQ